MGQIDIRLHGEQADVENTARLIHALAALLTTSEITPDLTAHKGGLRVLSESRDYTDRGASVLVRRYVKLSIEPTNL